MGDADAFQLDGVLAGLGKRDGIGVANQRRARGLKAGRGPVRRGRGLEQDALAELAHHVERAAKLPGRRQGHGIAQPGDGAVGDLAAVHEEIDMAVGMDQREPQRERGAWNVAATHVQQPGDRIGGGDQRDIGVPGRERRGDPSALALAGLAGKLHGMRQHGRERSGWPSAPYGVDGIGLDGHEAAARPLTGTGEAVVSVHRLQPGIEAELAALGQVLGDPLLGRLLGNLVRHERLDVDLVAHGQGIAAVDEDGGALRQDDGEARRTAEPGQPAQALGAPRHIFALMFVGAGHDEAVEPAALQFGAKSGQPLARGRARLQPVIGRREFCPPGRQRLGQFGVSRRIDQLDPLWPGQAFGGRGNAEHQVSEGGRVGGAAAAAEEGEYVVGSGRHNEKDPTRGDGSDQTEQ
jgi:hypothetical protein